MLPSYPLRLRLVPEAVRTSGPNVGTYVSKPTNLALIRARLENASKRGKECPHFFDSSH